LGCDSFSGDPDAEIVDRWLRTVEDIMEQIRVTEDLRVNCATHLLSDRARSWWDTVRSRRPTGFWTWTEFRVQFENQFYSSYHRKMKEQEFLALRQEGMTVLKYERRFHDLSMFAPQFVPTKQYMIDRLRDGLCQDLRQGLIALRFGTTRELIEAAQALEACIVEGQQSQTEVGKRKDINFSSSRPPLSKKGKGQFSQFRRKGGAVSRHIQSTGAGITSRQPSLFKFL